MSKQPYVIPILQLKFNVCHQLFNYITAHERLKLREWITLYCFESSASHPISIKRQKWRAHLYSTSTQHIFILSSESPFSKKWSTFLQSLLFCWPRHHWRETTLKHCWITFLESLQLNVLASLWLYRHVCHQRRAAVPFRACWATPGDETVCGYVSAFPSYRTQQQWECRERGRGGGVDHSSPRMWRCWWSPEWGSPPAEVIFPDRK